MIVQMFQRRVLVSALAVLGLGAPASGQTVLLVVPNAAGLTAQDAAKKTLMESWGMNVMLISANATQTAINNAAAAAQVAYVSEEISPGDLGTKLKTNVIGVVIEEAPLMDEFGFSSATTAVANQRRVDIAINSNHITSPWSIGSRTICSSNQPFYVLSGTIGGGIQTLADRDGGSTERMLVIIERGGALYGGGNAAGRRVKLPWGGDVFDVNALNTDGHTMMRRALNWASNDPTLVAYWNLNEGSGTVAADSATINNGTLMNGAAWTAGRLGNALNFDGFNDYVLVPNSTNLQITSGITIAAWIKADSWSAGNAVDVIARKGEDTPVNWQLAIRDARLFLLLDGYDLSPPSGYAGDTELATGIWYHVVGTWDGTTVKVYVDAELDATPVARGGTIGTDTRPAYIGGRAGAGVGQAADFFDGLFDDVRVYNRALSHAEVIALYDMFPLFTDVTSAMGFNVQTTTSEANGSGFHWADYDRDGDLDAIVTGNSARLMTNNNAGASFIASTFGGGNVPRQGAMADLDNDNDVDFWAANIAGADTEGWFSNNGSAFFTNSGNAGLNSPTNIEGAAAADLDADGWCDIVLFGGNANYVGVHQGALPVALTQSNGAVYGLNDSGDYGDGDYCSSADANNDGRLDFFYHYNSGKLFLSEGDGTYAENASGISVITGGSDKFGSAWGDFDDDGDMDLFTPRYDAGSAGYLWRNDGSTFANVAAAKGITNTTGQRSSCWGDYDNDGDLDLYICTTSGAAVLYRNHNTGTLFMVANTGAGVIGNKHDACFVDYDNDGDLDLSVAREATTNVLLRNNSNNSRYLKVRVLGAGAGATNTAAVGVRVELYDAAGTTLLGRREIGIARGFAGSEPLWAHFGGVDSDETYKVKVHFISGTQTVTVVPSSVSTIIGSRTIAQMLTVQEPVPPGNDVAQWVEVNPTP